MVQYWGAFWSLDHTSLYSHDTREAPAHWLIHPLKLGALQGGHTHKHPCIPSWRFEKINYIVGKEEKTEVWLKLIFPEGRSLRNVICQLKVSLTSFILTDWWSNNSRLLRYQVPSLVTDLNGKKDTEDTIEQQSPTQPFWHQELVSWKTNFPQTGGEGWRGQFGDDSSALHLLHTLFLLFLHLLHLRSSDISVWRLGVHRN